MTKNNIKDKDNDKGGWHGYNNEREDCMIRKEVWFIYDELKVLLLLIVLLSFLLSIFIICICCSSLFLPSSLVWVKLLPISLYHTQPQLQYNHRCCLILFNCICYCICFFSVSSSSYNCGRIVVVMSPHCVSSTSSFPVSSSSSSSSYSRLPHCCFVIFFLLLYSLNEFLYFKLFIWLIHFVRWIEVKAN